MKCPECGRIITGEDVKEYEREKEEQRKADVRAWAQKRFGDNADIAYRIICDGAGVRAL